MSDGTVVKANDAIGEDWVGKAAFIYLLKLHGCKLAEGVGQCKGENGYKKNHHAQELLQCLDRDWWGNSNSNNLVLNVLMDEPLPAVSCRPLTSADMTVLV